MSEASNASGGGAARAAIAMVALAIAGVAAYLLLSGPDEDFPPAAREAPATTAGADPAVGPPAGRQISPGVFVPDESGKLTIPGSAVRSGRPVSVELAIPVGDQGARPMTARLRSGGQTHEIGEAQLDPATGRARIAIDPGHLTPGAHLLAIETSQQSWNPNRRVVITVTAD